VIVGFGTILQKSAVCYIMRVGVHTSLPQYPPGVLLYGKNYHPDLHSDPARNAILRWGIMIMIIIYLPGVSSKNSTRSSAIAVIADRTACSILTLFIVTATSRPVNKNPFAVSPQMRQLLRICVRNPQSAHLCLHLQSAVGSRRRPWSAVAPNGTVS